ALNMGWYEASQPAIARVFPFPERKVRRMRVVQKSQAPYPQQWSAHELRFYNHGLELTRKTGWRLHAWPNPWQAQLAFDNSLATRWRSGETASPGMFLDVDFGQEESVDEVRLIASSDSEPAQLELESMNPLTGAWEKVAGNPPAVRAPVPPGIPRMATS